MNHFTCLPINIDKYKLVLNEKLINLQCKHVINNLKRNELTNLSTKVGYKWSILGSHRNSTIDDEIKRIKSMECGEISRSIRIVIDTNGRYWADNTHWTIAYILRYGTNINVCDVPCYIVDIDKKIIYSYKDSIYPITNDNLANITENSMDIQHRLDNGWRPLDINYTIKELMNDLDLITI